jgi:nucleotidyltransferase/DNA polymerase involved in DNA repair
MPLSKILTDKVKPNGQAILPSSRDKILDLVKDLPVRRWGGVGRVTEQLLAALGITKCAELHERRTELRLLWKDATFDFLLRAGMGIGATVLSDPHDRTRSSLGAERTFEATSNLPRLLAKMNELVDDISETMETEQIKVMDNRLLLTFFFLHNPY